MDGDDQLNLLASAQRPDWVEHVRDGVRRWAERGVYFGTSSWKYEGWLGQIYTAERYAPRGRFSQKRFEQHCLEEYAETFPTVCGDFSFYQFYSDDYWSRLFAQVPKSFRFGLKAPEIITCPMFPKHDRYGARAGQRNESFLDAALFKREFLDRLAPFSAQVGYIVFEFPEFPGGRTSRKKDEGGNLKPETLELRSQVSSLSPQPFLERLDAFLGALPSTFRYGVEIRARSLLGEKYLDCLRHRNVAHVFNSWTRMPTIGEQLAEPNALTADLTIARVLLRPGRSYEEAVRKFEPYSEIRDPYPEGYKDTARLIRATLQRSGKARAFVAINNRFTGNAPQTIGEILNELDVPT